MKLEEKRLPYLEITKERKEVRYLGYILPLTVGEYEVLKAVFCSDRFLNKNDIKNLIDDDVSANVKLSVSSIPIHVCSINRKALMANGRKIVVYKKNMGYCINENM